MNGWYGRSERLLQIVSGTAIWHDPGRLVPIRYVLVRDVADEFKPQAFLCTDLDADPLDILRWFVRRWSIEVTFAEVRRHLGLETQRQWSDPAIARTTPALLGLFSLTNELYAPGAPAPRAASWYPKPLPTFSDALAKVRRELWAPGNFETSSHTQDDAKISHHTVDRLINLACYAAQWAKVQLSLDGPIRRPILDRQRVDLAECLVVRHQHHAATERVRGDEQIERREDFALARHGSPHGPVTFGSRAVPWMHIDSPQELSHGEMETCGFRPLRQAKQ